MKIALCLSGHVRTYQQTHQFWNHHLFQSHDVDVFMHLWDTVGPRSFGKGFTERSAHPREDFDSGILDSPKVDISDVIRIWNPRKIIVEQYEGLHDRFVEEVKPVLAERDRRGIPAGFEHHHPLSVRSMLYKRHMCNQLKVEQEIMTGEEYDLTIQTRSDVAITKPILSQLYQAPKELYFHNCRSNTHDPEINDFGCMGTSSAVDEWCDLYLHIDGLFSLLKQDVNYFKFLNPHKMYVQYLQAIQQPYVETDLGLSIVRDTGIILGWPHDQITIKGLL